MDTSTPLPRYSPALPLPHHGSGDPAITETTHFDDHSTSTMAYTENMRHRTRQSLHPLTNPRDAKSLEYSDDFMGDPDNASYKAMRKTSQQQKTRRRRELEFAAGVTLIALFVRLYKISEPSSVVFDEVHFGGFASKYIRTRFFMDVHPPLAKLMIAGVAKLSGFDGQFDFKDIGLDYLEPKVPYVPMRLLCGLLGVFTVPIAYLTIKLGGHSTASALLAAMFVCFENGLVTNNRLILLDSPLLFYTSATTLMWINFHNQQNKPFKFWWWVWLAMTGLGLGVTVSSKWVGLFTIATIGTSTIINLWELLGDLRVSILQWTRHFMARALCLIVITLMVYMFWFTLHFGVLPNSGDGDGFMSSQFQASLKGHDMEDTPADVAFGSKVYIRHSATSGGYLHSHAHNYPSGSSQQQITLYPHKDNNNWWIIKKQFSQDIPDDGVEWVKHGDIIRLEHEATDKHLHSHDIRPPITDVEYHNEVSAYGFPGFDGDINDNWRVEIEDFDPKDPVSGDRLRTLHSRFRLVHTNQGCALFSHSVKLPDWGFEQQEVTCIKNGKIPKTIWYIEANVNPNLPPDTEMVNYKVPGFISKFIELNKVMWNTNKGLTDSHPFDSRPPSWLYLRRGISFWGKDHKSIYLLGNPFIWWLSTLAVVVYVLLRVFFILRIQRGYRDHFGGLRQFYEEAGGFYFIAWCFHYFPFYLMGRQLFLHHYMPSLYFAILLFAIGFDLATIRLPNSYRTGSALAMILVAIYVFSIFSPITYGLPWTRSRCERSKWLSTWDYDCNQYLDEIPPPPLKVAPPSIVLPDRAHKPWGGGGPAVVVEGDVDEKSTTTALNDDTPVEIDNVNIETDERDNPSPAAVGNDIDGDGIPDPVGEEAITTPDAEPTVDPVAGKNQNDDDDRDDDGDENDHYGAEVEAAPTTKKAQKAKPNSGHEKVKADDGPHLWDEADFDDDDEEGGDGDEDEEEEEEDGEEDEEEDGEDMDE